MNDPQRLQQLINSLTGRNCMGPDEHFKVRDEITKDMHGIDHITVSRVAYVRPLLERQYQTNVLRRGMKYLPLRGKIDPISLAVQYLTDPATRTSMMLYGHPGTGKTTLLRSMYDTLLALYDGQNTLTFEWCKASELGNVAKSDPQRFAKLKSCAVLFVDDLAFSGEGEVVNDYGVKRYPMETIIEHRYDRQLAMVCTTNLNLDGIKERYGPRIYSRVMELFMMVPVTGQDYRLTR